VAWDGCLTWDSSKRYRSIKKPSRWFFCCCRLCISWRCRLRGWH